MTIKEQRFCEFVLSGMSTVKAAEMAGYTRTTAKEAKRWITPPKPPQNPHKKFRSELYAYIQERQQEQRDKVSITQDDIIQELKKIAFADVDESLIRPADKIKAVEVMARICGLDRPDNTDVIDKLDNVIDGIDEIASEK